MTGIVFWVLVVLTGSQLVTVAGEPVAHVTYFSTIATREIYINQAIVIDASDSVHTSSGTLYYTFVYDDGTPSVGPTTSATDLHFFNTNGNIKVEVTVNDNTGGSTTNAGKMAPVIRFHVPVVKRPACFQFSVNGTNSETSFMYRYNSNSGANLTVLSQAHGKNGADASKDSTTFQFASLGEIPYLKVNNLSHVEYFRFDDNNQLQEQSWAVDFPRSLIQGSSSFVIGSVLSSGQSILGCTLDDSEFEFLDATFGTKLGDTLADLGSSPAQGVNIKTTNYQPSLFRIRPSSCSPSTAAAVLGIANPSVSYNGALVFITTDSFGPLTEIRDLLRMSSGTPGNFTVCKKSTWAECETLVVHDLVLSVNRAVCLTNQGLLVSGVNSEASSSLLDWTLIGEISPAITSLFSTGSMNSDYVQLFLNTRCENTVPKIHLVFRPDISSISSSTGLQSSLYQALEPFLTWTKLTIDTSVVSVTDGPYDIASAALNEDQNIVTIMIGIRKKVGNIWGFSKVKTILMSVENSQVTRTQAGFVFPSGDEMVGMDYHENEFDLYAYGSSVYWSVDNGISFFKLNTLVPGSYGISFSSSMYDKSFAIATSSKGVLYGKVGTDFCQPVEDPFYVDASASSTTTFHAIGQTNLGKVQKVSFSVPKTYPTSSSSYPTGFLLTVDGAVRGSSSPFLKTSLLPSNSIMRNSDNKPYSALAPVFINDITVIFFTQTDPRVNTNVDFNGVTLTTEQKAQYNAYTKFHQFHYSEQITSRSQVGSAEIEEVVEGTLYSACKASIKAPFEHVTNTQSPALKATISVGGYTLVYDTPTGTADNSLKYGSLSLAYPNVDSLTTQQVTLDLTLTNPGDEGWLYSDVGKSVLLNNGTFFITELVGKLQVKANVVQRMAYAGSAAPDKWYMYDFRLWDELAQVNVQTLTIGAAVAGESTVTLSAGSFQFTAAFVGKVLSTTFDYGATGGHGIFSQYISATQMKVREIKAFTAGVKNAGQFSIFDMADSNVYTPLISAPTYTVHSSNCSYDEFYSNAPARNWYLDRSETVVVESVIKYRSKLWPSNFKRVRANSLFYSVGNSSVINVTTLDTSVEVSNDTYSIRINIQGRSTTGSSVLSIRATDSMPICKNTSQDIQIFTECPPSKRAAWILPYGLTENDILYGDPKEKDGTHRLEFLPVNYRPPSYMGAAIPLTDNIYNGDPSEDLYRTTYKVSKESGKFKQCKDKANRAECGCTTRQRWIPFASNSDCVDRVIRYSIEENEFYPNFQIFEDNKPTKAMTLRYTLTELNGRTDYCPQEAASCSSKAELDSVIFDPAKNKSMLFSGSELYHFRMTVVKDNNTFCDISTELMIYIYDPSLPERIQWAIMAITSVAFGGVLLVVYLWYNYTRKGSY
eukprot:Nk52_evm7s1869 gene=Nk52_evmTU7s1869